MSGERIYRIEKYRYLQPKNQYLLPKNSKVGVGYRITGMTLGRLHPDEVVASDLTYDEASAILKLLRSATNDSE